MPSGPDAPNFGGTEEGLGRAASAECAAPGSGA